MIFFDVLETPVNSENNSIINGIDQIRNNIETLTNITDETFGIGDRTAGFGDVRYYREEYLTAINDKTISIHRTSKNWIIAANRYDDRVQVDIVTPVSNIDDLSDTNYLVGYKFSSTVDTSDLVVKNPLLQRLLTTSDSPNIHIVEKVVGTSFRIPKSFDEYDGVASDNIGDVRVKTVDALLIPEPNNPFDPNAVKVIARLVDGSAHHVGYLAKGGELQQHVKSPMTAKLSILAYSDKGDYNDQYKIGVDIKK